jgi:hypothetical protein
MFHFVAASMCLAIRLESPLAGWLALGPACVSSKPTPSDVHGAHEAQENDDDHHYLDGGRNVFSSRPFIRHAGSCGR